MEIDGETVETVSDFILGGSKITADGDCSHGIKRHLLLGRKVMTNLDSILKSRDITLPTKVRLVKAMVFPVVMYGYESWTVKGSQTEGAFHKSVTPGEALLSEVQGCEGNTELGGERYGSPGRKSRMASWRRGTVPGLWFLEPLKGNAFKINQGGNACKWIAGIPSCTKHTPKE